MKTTPQAADPRAARVRFPWRVFSRIVMLQVFLTIAALGGTALAARYFVKTRLISQTQEHARVVTALLAHELSVSGGLSQASWCDDEAVEINSRVVLLWANGKILCDSDRANPALNDFELGLIAKASETGARSDHGLHLVSAATPIGLAEGGHRPVLLVSSPLLGVERTLHLFDAGLFVALVAVGLGIGAFSVVSSGRLVVPLGQLILKAREAAEGDLDSLPAVRGSEGGEWVELETALNRIQIDLRQKTEALSREREELATLMGAISDAIIAVDGSGKPLFFNSRFALLFFDKELRGKQPHLGEIFRSPEVLSAFHAALRDGVSPKASVPLYTRTDSAQHYFSLSVAPLRRDIGPVYGAVGIFHDVTELKRAENIRIEFVANVSHELRTPLTAIKGYTDTLREDVSKRQFDSAEDFLSIIARNVDRLMGLIGDLLDLSSLESSDTGDKLTRAPVDTQELTARVLAQLEGRRTEKKHSVETQFGAPTVFADAARIEQVLVNLLENAIKYIPAAGKITVSWENGKDSVLLRVSDNGPGIPAEHHSRLFERFYRVDKGRSRDMGGTGLGLAIVKHIMQRHNGAVWVESEPGRGTEFICQFPVS